MSDCDWKLIHTNRGSKGESYRTFGTLPGKGYYWSNNSWIQKKRQAQDSMDGQCQRLERNHTAASIVVIRWHRIMDSSRQWCIFQYSASSSPLFRMAHYESNETLNTACSLSHIQRAVIHELSNCRPWLGCRPKCKTVNNGGIKNSQSEIL